MHFFEFTGGASAVKPLVFLFCLTSFSLNFSYSFESLYLLLRILLLYLMLFVSLTPVLDVFLELNCPDPAL